MITLTSDFGLKDPYVAEMKGVILTINPKTTIVDISHDIEKFNIRMAAFILASAAPYFPENTVHLAVVDPEVGTNRRAILIHTKKSFFVGPDNGILVLAAQKQGIKKAYQLTNPQLMLPKITSTFHGRDIFAPAAAYLKKGIKPAEFGPEINDLIQPEFACINRNGDSIIGEVIHIDDFGNIITNINEKDIQNGCKIVTMGAPLVSLKLTFDKTYAQAKSREPIAVVGSHGFVEIAVNQCNAAEKFHVKAGDKITFNAA
jgi:S-adenosylmethionine hydrolase